MTSSPNLGAVCGSWGKIWSPGADGSNGCGSLRIRRRDVVWRHAGICGSHGAVGVTRPDVKVSFVRVVVGNESKTVCVPAKDAVPVGKRCIVTHLEDIHDVLLSKHQDAKCALEISRDGRTECWLSVPETGQCCCGKAFATVEDYACHIRSDFVIPRLGSAGTVCIHGNRPFACPQPVVPKGTHAIVAVGARLPEDLVRIVWPPGVSVRNGKVTTTKSLMTPFVPATVPGIALTTSNECVWIAVWSSTHKSVHPSAGKRRSSIAERLDVISRLPRCGVCGADAKQACYQNGTRKCAAQLQCRQCKRNVSRRECTRHRFECRCAMPMCRGECGFYD